MDFAKAVSWAITGLFILFALWVGSIVLSIGLGILGFVASILGGLLHLMLSKTFLSLAAIGVVVYLLCNREKKTSYYHGYHY